MGAEARGVAGDDALAQRIDAGGHVDRIARVLAAPRSVLCSDSNTDRYAAVPVLPALGGKLNSTIAILRSARGVWRSVTRRSSRAASAAHVQAPPACRWLRLHRDRPSLAPPGALLRVPPGAAAEHHRTDGAVEFGDRHHDGAFHRQSVRARRLPLLQGLEFEGMRGDVGHVERGQQFLGGPGVVVGGTADQRESGQRHHRIDGRAPLRRK